MPALFDAQSSNSVANNGATTLSWLHTPAGTPTSVGVSLQNYTGGGVSVSGVKYGGNALTKYAAATSGSTGVGNHTEIYGSDGVALPTGPQTVQITFSGIGAYCIAGAITVAGSDTTNCFSNANAANATSAAPSVVCTSAVGELVMSMAINDSSDTTLSTSQTLRWGPVTDSGQVGSCSTAAASGGSTTMSWTCASEAWTISAASFKAAAGGGSTSVYGNMSMMGVG